MLSEDGEVMYLWQQDNLPVTTTELAFQSTKFYSMSIAVKTLTL